MKSRCGGELSRQIFALRSSVRSQWQSLWSDRCLATLVLLGVVALVGQLTYPFVQRGLLFTLTWTIFTGVWVWRRELGRWGWVILGVMALGWCVIDVLSIWGDAYLREDFETNDAAARRLYGEGVSPYEFESGSGLLNYSISFPFPTYFLFWACSWWGALDPHQTFVVFRILMTLVYVSCWAVLLSGLPSESFLDDRRWWWRAGLLFLALAGWGWSVIGMGQTSLVVWLGLLAWWRARWTLRWPWLMLGAAGGAVAMLTKPMIALILLAGVLAWWRGRIGSRQWGAWVTIGTPVWAAVFVGLTMVWPGGVSWETYATWMSRVLPRAEAYTVTSSTNFSPAVWLSDSRIEVVASYEIPAGLSWMSYARTLREQGRYQVQGTASAPIVPTVLGKTGRKAVLGLGRIVQDPARWWWRLGWGAWCLGLIGWAWWRACDVEGWLVVALLCSPLVWCHYLVWWLPVQALTWWAMLRREDESRAVQWGVCLSVLNSWVPLLSQIGLLWCAWQGLTWRRKEGEAV